MDILKAEATALKTWQTFTNHRKHCQKCPTGKFSISKLCLAGRKLHNAWQHAEASLQTAARQAQTLPYFDEKGAKKPPAPKKPAKKAGSGRRGMVRPPK